MKRIRVKRRERPEASHLHPIPLGIARISCPTLRKQMVVEYRKRLYREDVEGANAMAEHYSARYKARYVGAWVERENVKMKDLPTTSDYSLGRTDVRDYAEREVENPSQVDEFSVPPTPPTEAVEREREPLPAVTNGAYWPPKDCTSDPEWTGRDMLNYTSFMTQELSRLPGYKE